jgi:hypothetical protein
MRDRRANTVDRRLLQQALQQGQQISAQAVSGRGFDPRGGVGVLAAQLATAGIGAFAQNRARKQLAEQEQQAQQAFSAQFPQFASLAGQLTPETRQALIAKQLGGQIAQQFAPAPTPLSPEGKKAADIQAGFLPEDTSLAASPDLEKKKERIFKQTTDLRKEFTKNSGDFIKQRDAFNKVKASASDPSAAGDIALVINFMKVLDPGSVVREGEFANAARAGGLGERLVAAAKRVDDGKLLSPKQRQDFLNRSTKLFDSSLQTQRRRIEQFKGIARRNQLPEQDVLLDLIGNDPVKAEAVAEVETQTETTGQEPTTSGVSREQALEELRRRGIVQ